MSTFKRDKTDRILTLYKQLMDGHVINKVQFANDFGVDERSVQRDIDDIRVFLEAIADDGGSYNTIVYDRNKKGYRIGHNDKMNFTNSEILAICKILLDSRAFTKEEMSIMLHKLITCCVPKENRKLVTELIRNEAFHYVEPRHKTKFIDTMWEIGQAIRSCQWIEIDYFRLKDKSIVKRKLKPVSIMFSEYYFYMAAFIEDKDVRKDFDVINDSFPTIYRIDRIKRCKVLDEKFHIPYSSRFEEGEFRKRIQFMYGGKLQKIKFEYSGLDIDAILDRLPTAQVVSENNGVYTVSAEVFGKGIDMWLRSQGDMVKVISPAIE